MTDSLELLESLVPELPQARQAELFGQALQDASRQLEAMKLDVGRTRGMPALHRAAQSILGWR